MRTCIICGKKSDKTSLIRFVPVHGVIVPDEKYQLPGRGAYSCRQEKCLRMLARKEKKLAKALHTEGRLAEQWRLPFEITLDHSVK